MFRRRTAQKGSSPRVRGTLYLYFNSDLDLCWPMFLEGVCFVYSLGCRESSFL